MIDYKELISSALKAVEETNSDILKLHGKSTFVRCSLEDGSLLIEIHSKETEDLYNARYE